MKKNYNEVYIVKSYEEAVQCEKKNTSPTFKKIGFKLAIYLRVSLANVLLSLMKIIWFNNKKMLVNHVVIYTVGTLGDNILMLPAVAAIREKYSFAKLTMITNCDGFSSFAARQVWEKSVLVDHFVPLPDHPVQRDKYTLKINVSGIEKKCDLFVNLSPFGNRGWLGAVVREMIFAKKLGAKQAIGFSIDSYNRKGAFNQVQHLFVKNEARRPRAVLKKLDLSPIEWVDLLPHDRVAKVNVENMLLEKNINVGKGPIILLNPGSKLAASRWPAHCFGEFAAWLTEMYDAKVLINGVETEDLVCEDVVSASGGQAINLAGKLSIQELIELLRLSDACISNNTGTMTLAAMIKTPLIVVSSTRFSPTFYMPISAKMIWLFSFSEQSYSYNDLGLTSEDMLNIKVKHLISAYKELIEMNCKD